MIETQDLSLRFGHTLALDSINVNITPGATGLFGENGSGKTTLLRVIAGLLRPTQGRVVIDGEPQDGNPEALRRRLGFAGHEPGLVPQLSVEENLALFARLYDAPANAARRMIELLDLARWRHVPAGELSAGLSRRAAVARALTHDPDFLLLDEPYANLDDEATEIVTRAILAWLRKGKTCLIASHGAKKVKRYADAGIILKRGRVVVAGRYARGGDRANSFLAGS